MAAYVIRLAAGSTMKNNINGSRMILYPQPVAHILPLTVHRNRLVVLNVVDGQRNQLLRKMVRPVVVRAIGNNRVQPELSVARDERAEELKVAGAELISSVQRNSTSWAEVEEDLTDEEHVTQGDRYKIDYSGDVTWYRKTAKQISEQEVKDRELKRGLAWKLPQDKDARQKFIGEKIRDKKGLTDAQDRELMAEMIFVDLNFAGQLLLAKVIKLEHPNPDDDYVFGDDAKARKEWEAEAFQVVRRMQLGQQVRLQAALAAAGVEKASEKINVYGRTSWEKEIRWKHFSTWYGRLIKYFGYVPSQSERDAIEFSAREAKKDLDVDFALAGTGCKVCGTEPLEIGEATGAQICTGCEKESTNAA